MSNGSERHGVGECRALDVQIVAIHLRLIGEGKRRAIVEYVFTPKLASIQNVSSEISPAVPKLTDGALVKAAL